MAKERQQRRNILVHTCRAPRYVVKPDDLEPGKRYFPTSDENTEFRLVPDKCNCRKKITLSEAADRVAVGKAWYLWKKKHNRPIILNGYDEESKCEAVFTPVVRTQTPRVDMITAADIQRAYIGSERKTRWYVYSRIKKRYVRLPVLLADAILIEGCDITQKDVEKYWQEDAVAEQMIEAFNHKVAQKEITRENNIRKQYKEYIDTSYEMMLEERAKLIAPFKEDPIPGRLLSPLY